MGALFGIRMELVEKGIARWSCGGRNGIVAGFLKR